MSIIEKAVDKFETDTTAEGKKLGYRRGSSNRKSSRGRNLELRSIDVADHLTKLKSEQFADIRIFDGLQPIGKSKQETLEQTRNEFARIKHPILHNIKQLDDVDGSNLSVVMVASSLENEGKTFTAINLARNLAKSSEKHVVLIDADIIKKEISIVLKLQDALGLTDVITGACKQVEKAICKTEVANLKIVSAGKSRDIDPQLLSGYHMRQFIEFLLGPKKKSDVIIVVDSSPILSTSEAQFLATLAGQVLFVVNAGQTPAGAVKQSLEYIDNAKPIGMVLNKASEKEMSGYYTSYNYSAS